jgi:hypothetical protein
MVGSFFMDGAAGFLLCIAYYPQSKKMNSI